MFLDGFVIAGPRKVCNNHFASVISIAMGRVFNQPTSVTFFG